MILLDRTLMVDANGHMIAPAYYVEDQDSATAWADALQAYSCAAPQLIRITYQYPYAGVTAPGPYAGVDVAAELMFENVDALRTRVLVPAPLASIFRGDGETVDPAAAAGLITSAMALLRAINGGSIGPYQRGLRRALPRSL